MRYDDWPTKLVESLKEAKNKPFVWGEHDCCLFAADIVKAMTGDDLAAGYRGKYSTAKEAIKLIKKISNDGTVAGIVDLHFKRVPVSFAKRGDIVSVQTNHGEAIGVCAGGGAHFVIESGTIIYPRPLWSIAWRVV